VSPSLLSATAVAGVAPVIVAIGLIFAAFGVGWGVFTREAPRVAENL
jgi:hypothetical protein